MRRAGATLALVLGAFCSEARADSPPATPAPAQPSPKRAVPDYDGRGPEPTQPGDVAVWIPRVVLSPLYVVSEYVIRWPLSVAIPAAERADLPRKIYDFFTFGPEHKAGFAPVGFYDFGFNPSVGVYAFWNDAGFKGNDWHVHVEAWPTDWLGGSLTDHIQIDARHAVTFRIEGIRRPDHVYYGMGPDTAQSNQSRFGEDRLEGGAVYQWRFVRGSFLETGAGLRAVSLYDGHYGSDPSLTAEAATGAFRIPPGFGVGYAEEYNRALLVLDSRRPWPEPGSGVRADFRVEQGNDFRQSPASGWLRYGAGAGGYLDLNGRGRVVRLGVQALFADPLGDRPVPFTELPSLGGDAPMRGYHPGRLVGPSAATAAGGYTWPIGPWLAGTIEAAVGNVFGEHLQGFRPGRLRFSGDIGISAGLSEYPVALVVGVGSDTFEQGGSIRLPSGQRLREPRILVRDRRRPPGPLRRTPCASTHEHGHLSRASQRIRDGTRRAKERVVASLFDVRPGEARGTVTGFAALLLLVIGAHTTLETARDALLLTGPGPRALGFVYMAIAAGTVPAAALVARAGERYGQRRALAGTLAVAVAGPIFLFLVPAGPAAAISTYILSGILGSIPIPQFWMLVGTVLTVAQGRRLFGLISTGGILGESSGPRQRARRWRSFPSRPCCSSRRSRSPPPSGRSVCSTSSSVPWSPNRPAAPRSRPRCRGSGSSPIWRGWRSSSFCRPRRSWRWTTSSSRPSCAACRALGSDPSSLITTSR